MVDRIARFGKDFGTMASGRMMRWVLGATMSGLVGCSALMSSASDMSGTGEGLAASAVVMAGWRVMGIVDASPGVSKETLRAKSTLQTQLSEINAFAEKDLIAIADLRNIYMKGVQDATAHHYDDARILDMISQVAGLADHLMTSRNALHARLQDLGIRNKLASQISEDALRAGIGTAQIRADDQISALGEYLRSDAFIAKLDGDVDLAADIEIVVLQNVLSIARDIDAAVFQDIDLSRDAADPDLSDREPEPVDGMCRDLVPSPCEDQIETITFRPGE